MGFLLNDRCVDINSTPASLPFAPLRNQQRNPPCVRRRVEHERTTGGPLLARSRGRMTVTKRRSRGTLYGTTLVVTAISELR